MDDHSSIDFVALDRFLRGESFDAYKLFGCHFAGDGLWRFTVWAPNAAAVALTGDFNGWSPVPMTRLDCGAWTLCHSAKQGEIYKYAVTDHWGNTVLKSDPYASHCETPPANGSRVWDIGGYSWHDADFLDRHHSAMRYPHCRPISVYELHLGSWKAPEPGAHFPNYHSIAEQLAAYCTEMGYTHVELLPVTEYPFAPSWGYQVTGYFAPTSRYGTPQDFMYLVDTLHRSGIGVILDWVPAHFPRDAHALAYFDGTPLYERRDPKMAAHPDWGTLIFDYANPAVRSFLKSSAAMFLREYHVDGFRMDAVSSMLYLSFNRGGDYIPNRFGGDVDLDAVSLLQEINDFVRSEGGISIAEESSTFPSVTGPTDRGGLGFHFKWDMGFMHDTLDYMELDPLWRRGSHTKLSFSMMYTFTEHFILAFSHDEVVHGKKSMLDKMPGTYDDKFANLRTLYGFTFAHPGKKHIFMGGEYGQFIEWDFQKELDWFLLEYPRHAQMQVWYQALNRLYVNTPALWERDDSWSGFAWLNVDDADRSCIALMRISNSGQRIVCVCNFTPTPWELQVALPCAGTLEPILSSDEVRFGGGGQSPLQPIAALDRPFRDCSHSAFLSLPPLSCIYYDFKEEPHESRA